MFTEIKQALKIAAIAVGLAFCAGVSANAQGFIYSTNVSTASTNQLIVGPARCNQLQILAGSQPVTVTLYDSSSGGVTYTSPAYVGYTNQVQTNTYTYVNQLVGTTNYQTNVVLVGSLVTNAASTNLYPSYTYFAAANTLATYPLTILTARGVVATTSTNAAISLFYRVNQ